MFYIKIADLKIRIRNRYNYVFDLCKNYIIDECDDVDLDVSVSEEQTLLFGSCAECTGGQKHG